MDAETARIPGIRRRNTKKKKKKKKNPEIPKATMLGSEGRATRDSIRLNHGVLMIPKPQPRGRSGFCFCDSSPKEITPKMATSRRRLRDPAVAMSRLS